MKLLLSLLSFYSIFIPLWSDKIKFDFSYELIDVVIPAVEKDLATLEMCIRGIKENGQNIRRVIVISKNELSKNAEWFDETRFPFSLKDIKNELSLGDIKRTNALKSTNRTGWYFQQLLKLYAPSTIPDISSNILILDSDTIFLKKIEFLNENNASIFSLGYEYHLPYFEHAPKLIPNFKKQHKMSGIIHHMLFQKAVLNILFEEVEQTHQIPFWKAFCNLVALKDLAGSGASEYEIYFNYALSKSDQFSTRKLKWSNLNKLENFSTLKGTGLDMASIHSYSRIP